MVLLGRIELPTSPLPRVRSTTELQQRTRTAQRDAGDEKRGLCAAGRLLVNIGGSSQILLYLQEKNDADTPQRAKQTPGKRGRLYPWH